MRSQSPRALRVVSSREALRNYELPPGGATLNPCRAATLAAVLGAQAPIVELSPAPPGLWIWSAFVAGIALAFAAGWWLGRMALGYAQRRALTQARFNVERSRVLAHELQDRCVVDTAAVGEPALPQWAIVKLEAFKGRTYDDAGEIVRQTASAGQWLGDVRWPRPLGVPVDPAPQKVFPFAPANRKVR